MDQNKYDYLIKKKKFSVRVSQLFMRAVKAVHHKGLEIQTIMFVPHSEKRIFNFHLYNYTIVFLGLIVAALVAFAGVTVFAKRAPVDVGIKSLREETKKAQTILKRYRDNAKQFTREYDAYETELKSLYVLTGMTYPSGEGRVSISNSMTIPSPYAYPNDADTLLKLNAELDRSRSHLATMVKLLELRRSLVSAIPSAWPVKDYLGQRTSGYGIRSSPFANKRVFHKGIDIAFIQGTPIVATADGTVTFADWLGGYGQTVIVDHKYGFRTLYGHNYRINVVAGQRVRKGDTIALMGKTGRVTGVHTHYEVRIGDVPVDPWAYMTTRF
ncbi:MAG: M23 family metallopeptidase [Spirochaetes bacterium]|nr:M23 family metallopeptidase [Spirochaetota bacterium]